MPCPAALMYWYGFPARSPQAKQPDRLVCHVGIHPYMCPLHGKPRHQLVRCNSIPQYKHTIHRIGILLRLHAFGMGLAQNGNGTLINDLHMVVHSNLVGHNREIQQPARSFCQKFASRQDSALYPKTATVFPG